MNMKNIRIIPKLDIKSNNLVKGIYAICSRIQFILYLGSDASEML